MRDIFYRISKVISTAVFIVLILLIALILAYIFRVNYMTKHDRLGEVRMNMYTILTQSMYPTIKAGDVVITYKNLDNKYDEGDIITFVSESNTRFNITHRIVKVYNVNGVYSYQTKGDANNTADSEIVKGENILGQVKIKLPKVGYFQQFMTSKFGFIVAVLLPCLGIVIYDILKLFKVATRKSMGVIKKDTSNDEEARKKLKEVMDSEDEQL